ncbi:polymorphic outer membrane protein, partial [Chlamydia psittaci 03DC29]
RVLVLKSHLLMLVLKKH